MKLSKGKLALIVIIIVVLLILCTLVFSYNELVRLDQEVDANWSEIKNQDQRKLDLIPQMVTLLQGYQEFESSTLVEITALRSGYLNATTDQERANISMQRKQKYI